MATGEDIKNILSVVELYVPFVSVKLTHCLLAVHT